MSIEEHNKKTVSEIERTNGMVFMPTEQDQENQTDDYDIEDDDDDIIGDFSFDECDDEYSELDDVFDNLDDDDWN